MNQKPAKNPRISHGSVLPWNQDPPVVKTLFCFIGSVGKRLDPPGSPVETLGFMHSHAALSTESRIRGRR